MKIITAFIQPPIAIRNFDWTAYIDGKEEDGPYGYGATEQQALTDLEYQLEAEEVIPRYENRQAFAYSLRCSECRNECPHTEQKHDQLRGATVTRESILQQLELTKQNIAYHMRLDAGIVNWPSIRVLAEHAQRLNEKFIDMANAERKSMRGAA